MTEIPFPGLSTKVKSGSLRSSRLIQQGLKTALPDRRPFRNGLERTAPLCWPRTQRFAQAPHPRAGVEAEPEGHPVRTPPKDPKGMDRKLYFSF